MAKSPAHDASARKAEPIIITAAEPSYDEQLSARRKRYVITMGTRVPLLIVATLLYQHLWIAIPLLLISIPLPWMAVLLANDRPARNFKVKAPLPGVINYERALPPSRQDVIDGD
ncbi:DUF3099 domain-containing protein [Nakamurella sp. PAMC28650]|jgi:hypothetical protein|uniref:DUF3099 domain-containing protein n=1 Tax=Nakamurella sp. PAMC28650 TaxID=2762325 RepID=UPI00164E5547|nr:DUF3099 domain-containing protein [Nakamurella sp. PAMC28650]QNK79239.1 DUF3099 domain-containing protein [Nakamurella sp. PAMC28650]